MAGDSSRFTGNPDFHDGFIREVYSAADDFLVTVEGYSGSRYRLRFRGVQSVKCDSPEGMMLYAVSEADTETEGLRCYVFVNSFADEP